MAASQPPSQPTGKSLFSQHYLTTRLRGQPEWQEAVQAPLTALHTLGQQAQGYPVIVGAPSRGVFQETSLC